MNDKILNECRQAKERIAVLFRDVDTLMDFFDETAGTTSEAREKMCRFLTLSGKENEATVNHNIVSACGSTL